MKAVLPTEYDAEKTQNLLLYVKRVNPKRGELINDTINLESILDDFISTHFCKDKTRNIELREFII
jgi:hypothetical protein